MLIFIYLNGKLILTSPRKEYLFKWCKKSGEFQVKLTSINFVLYTALPDEVLVEVFKNFSLKEMLKTLCLVSRSWRHIVNNNNILWSCLLLNEWRIWYLSEEQFINITLQWVQIFIHKIYRNKNIRSEAGRITRK